MHDAYRRCNRRLIMRHNNEQSLSNSSNQVHHTAWVECVGKSGQRATHHAPQTTTTARTNHNKTECQRLPTSPHQAIGRRKLWAQPPKQKERLPDKVGQQEKQQLKRAPSATQNGCVFPPTRATGAQLRRSDVPPNHGRGPTGMHRASAVAWHCMAHGGGTQSGLFAKAFLPRLGNQGTGMSSSLFVTEYGVC